VDHGYDELAIALTELAAALGTDSDYAVTAKFFDNLARRARAGDSEVVRRTLSILALGEFAHVVLYRDGAVSPEQSRIPKLFADLAEAARNAPV
jgi:hypothetical protein